MKGRLRIWLYWLPVLAVPLLLAGVNSASPAPDRAYRPDRCTRYCHDHGCPHLEAAWIEKPLQAHMEWLRANPFGLAYQTINLVLYVLLLPLLAWLLYLRLIRITLPR